MTLPTRPWWFLLPLLCACVLVSCDSQTEIRSTIPPDGGLRAPRRTIVAVQLNNSITESDVSSLNPENFVVTGDLTEEPYSGTLALGKFSRLSYGTTVDNFDATQAVGPDEEPLKPDAIVFLLSGDTTFKEGERITVRVNDKVTAHTAPVQSGITFRFQVETGSGSLGDLEVDWVQPASQTVGVPAASSIGARFSRAVGPDALSSAITVRGSESGIHTGGVTASTVTQGSGGVLEVLRRLAAGDTFVPGELVDVTLSSAIQESSTTGTTEPANLIPYSARFQVESGRVTEGWSAVDLADGFGAPVEVLAADFIPGLAGAEIAVVEEERLTFLSQEQPGLWLARQSSLEGADEEYSPVGAFTYDVRADGTPDVVVVLSSSSGSRLVTFELSDANDLVPFGRPAEIPATGLTDWIVADLDSSGKPEVILTHPDRSYVSELTSLPASTGTMTVLEQQSIAPDPSQIDIGNPDSLLPTPGFQAVETSLSGKPLARRIAAVEISGDGRLDLVLETASGFVFLENLGRTASEYPFRSHAAPLKRPAGGSAVALAWTGADLDGDRDVDLIVWDTTGATLFYPNLSVVSDAHGSLTSKVLDISVEPIALATGELSFVQGSKARVAARDVDSDGLVDLVVSQKDGATTLLLETGLDAPSFQTLELTSSSTERAVIADVNGDSGLDVPAIAPVGGGHAVRAFLATGVVPPDEVGVTAFTFAPESSGYTDLSGDEIRIGILGDLKDEFTGYSIALDYDEAVLQYAGFEPPDALVRKASFSLCPDANLQGCSGFATAKMTYLQGTRGAPVDGLLLGTFIFQRPAVDEPTSTVLELTDLTGSNSTTYANLLSVAEGSARFDVPAAVPADGFEIVVQPPDPEELVIECSVESREGTELTGLVSWSSPAALSFSEFRLRVGSASQQVFPGSALGAEFATSETGVIPVIVTARTTGGVLYEASCEVIGIHEPEVLCEAVTDSENRVTWTLSHAVDRFVIYRNGVRIRQTADGSVTEFLDTSASTTGADNYGVAGIIDGVEGPLGSCAGGPVGDPDVETTLPPKITEARLLTRTSPSDPNSIRCRWTNEEGYDSIEIAVERVSGGAPVATRTLAGTATELVYSGATAVGGVPPGQYLFSVIGTVRGVDSEPARSIGINVPVPTLSPDLTCTVDAEGDILVSWDPLWQGYTALSLVIDHGGEGVPSSPPQTVPLSVAATEYVLSGQSPVGYYDIELVAEYDAPLPASLIPDPESLKDACRVSFDPRMLVERVVTGVGFPTVRIPVIAESLGALSGFRFELEYPDFLEIDPVSGLLLEGLGAPASVSFTIESGLTVGTLRAIVNVSGASIPVDQDGDGFSDGRVVLATLVGSLPENFGIVGEHGLTFRGDSLLRFRDAGDIAVATEDAQLVVRRRFAWLDEATIVAGSQEEIPLYLRATFDAPASAPNYRMNAIQIHLSWDPDVLDLLPVRELDQSDTALADIGTFFLPTQETYTLSRANGDLRVSWLGFQFSNPTEPDFLYPGVALKILKIRFRSKVPGDVPTTTFARVAIVSDPDAELPTAFFPEVDVPSVEPLEAFIDGGVRVLSGEIPFDVVSLSPARGPLAGGGEARIDGTGLLPAGTGVNDVAIRFVRLSGGGDPVIIPVETILEANAQTIRFLVPPAGSLPAGATTIPADVEVATPAGSETLVGAYAYDAPAVTGFDRTSGRASGGQLLVLSGAGFSTDATVAFEVPGAPDAFPAQVSSVDADGTRIHVLTPDLTGFENLAATLVATVPGFDPIVAPGSFQILPDSSGGELRLDSVTPSAATICGGAEVTLFGDGFVPGLSVRFGDREAASVTVVDAQTISVLSPSVEEGTTSVDIVVVTEDEEEVRLEDAFTFEHPAGPFLRGDVNEDETLSVSDAVDLSALVLGSPEAVFPTNHDAADVNDDGVINGGDVTLLMNYLFASGSPPSPPVDEPGYDPTPDSITSCGS